MWRTNSFEKTLMLGKNEGRREGDNRGWDGWMASPTQWTWVWVVSRNWWWTGKPGVLHMESQRVRHNWATELKWTESVMLSYHLILCHLLLLLPSVFPSIRVFSNELVLHIRCPNYWSFSFSISPSNEYSELISFKMDWMHLLAVQGTLKSLFQHHSSKASILQCSAFFTDQLSHPYMTTGKAIPLTRWTFVGKVMFLLLNMLSRLVIVFLPRSKSLLISWL